VLNATGNAWDVAMAVGMAVIQDEAVKGRNLVLEVEFASVLKEVN
jgi:hypothetical protein